MADATEPNAAYEPFLLVRDRMDNRYQLFSGGSALCLNAIGALTPEPGRMIRWAAEFDPSKEGNLTLRRSDLLRARARRLEDGRFVLRLWRAHGGKPEKIRLITVSPLDAERLSEILGDVPLTVSPKEPVEPLTAQALSALAPFRRVTLAAGILGTFAGALSVFLGAQYGRETAWAVLGAVALWFCAYAPKARSFAALPEKRRIWYTLIPWLATLLTAAMGAFRDHYVDGREILLPALVAGLAAFALFCVAAAVHRLPRRTWIAALLASILLFGPVLCLKINTALYDGAYTLTSVRVAALEKASDYRSGYNYFATVELADGEARLGVSPSAYRSLKVGDRVQYREETGALGIRTAMLDPASIPPL